MGVSERLQERAQAVLDKHRSEWDRVADVGSDGIERLQIAHRQYGELRVELDALLVERESLAARLTQLEAIAEAAKKAADFLADLDLIEPTSAANEQRWRIRAELHTALAMLSNTAREALAVGGEEPAQLGGGGTADGTERLHGTVVPAPAASEKYKRDPEWAERMIEGPADGRPSLIDTGPQDPGNQVPRFD